MAARQPCLRQRRRPVGARQAALAGFDAAAAITVTEIQLILLGRDEHVYRVGDPGNGKAGRGAAMTDS